MNKKLITGIHHINLKANGEEGLKKAVHFYRDVLGLSEVRHWDGDEATYMLTTGNGIIEINMTGKEEPKNELMGHLTLAADDVDKVAEVVRAAGYPIIAEPNDATKPSNPVFRVRYAETIGPCGEYIVFFKEYE